MSSYLADFLALIHCGLKDTLVKVLYALTPKGVLPGLDRVFDLLGPAFAGAKMPLTKRNKVGALGLKAEGGGKVRVFAMVDYYTQSALKPVHQLLDQMLKITRGDGTFHQERLADQVRELTKRGRQLFSFDLEGATDRLPVTLQKRVMSKLLGEAFANAWAELLVGRDYWLHGKPLRYSVGQPMGAYSS